MPTYRRRVAAVPALDRSWAAGRRCPGAGCRRGRRPQV